MLSRTLGIMFIILVSVGSTSSYAGGGGADNNFTFRAGTFLTSFDTSVALTGPNGGDEINLEDTLGLDSDETVFRSELTWRFQPRHRVSLGYYSFERSSGASLENDFVVDLPNRTYTFQQGARVSAEFDWTVIPITYSYSFFQGDKTEIAGIIGAHWLDTEVGFKGEAQAINDDSNEVFELNASPSDDVSGPLPVVGFQIDHKLNEKWKVGGRVQYFGLEVDDVDGRLLDSQIYLERKFHKNVSGALAYTDYNTSIKQSRDRSRGEYNLSLDHDYDGIEAYLTFNF